MKLSYFAKIENLEKDLKFDFSLSEISAVSCEGAGLFNKDGFIEKRAL